MADITPGSSVEKKVGFWARLAKTTRYLITGVDGNSYFSPGQPLRPQGPPASIGRALDFPIGWNLRTQTRQQEGISFWELQALADNHDITRTLIETRKDQMEALIWTIRVKDQDEDNEPSDEDEARIKQCVEFFKKPDGVLPFGTWLRMVLEDLLVIDAPSIYVDETEPGNTKFRILAGNTINRLIDDYGMIPQEPEPAYQQIIKGMPAWNYSADELIYMPRNPRPGHLYGMSPVQQIVILVNIALRRQISQLQYYTDGNIPDALIGTPKEWTPEQIAAYQKFWDEMNSGNTAERRRAKFVPGDGKILPTREVHLKDEFDEWLARIACYAFSVPPTAFVKMMNRGTASTAKEAATEEGLAPLMRWAKQLIDLMLQKYLGMDDLEFSWSDSAEEDPEIQVNIIDKELRNATLTINEARALRGRDGYGADGDIPLVFLPSGPVKLSDIIAAPSPEEQAQAQAEASAQAHANAVELAGMKQTPASGPGNASGKAAPIAPGTRRLSKSDTGGEPKMKTLYVSRDLLNGDDIVRWAAANGFTSTLDPEDMHCTIVYSKAAVDWNLVGESDKTIVVTRGDRSLELFDDGALVMRFKSYKLTDRFDQMINLGAQSKFFPYKPHITLTYKGDDLDLDAIEPYAGKLIFGPEHIKEVNEGWKDEIVEVDIDPKILKVYRDKYRPDAAHY